MKCIFIMFLLIVLFYLASSNISALNEGVRSSFMRKSMPLYIFMGILFTQSIFFIKTKNKKFALLIIFILIVSSITYFSMFENGSLTNVLKRSNRLDELTNQIKNTKENSIIITNYLSYAVPFRTHQTLLIYKEERLTPTYKAMYPTLNTYKEIENLLVNLSKKNIDIYIMKDANLLHLINYLVENNYKLETYSDALYKFNM